MIIMAKHILVTGVVQGVGFRPFAYALATRLNLHGWVSNTSAGVEIYIEGSSSNAEVFIEKLTAENLHRPGLIPLKCRPGNPVTNSKTSIYSLPRLSKTCTSLFLLTLPSVLIVSA